ncbi:acetyl ornithine aminotransferase family protein [Infirmifilum sp. NZ]|uniref:acetyl ornithine aminotransferase family protein n=1 Tax=Infirmifilum sp. NZ TaxID=2926850 RepID=UPI0027AA8EAE|nr:acetyl ornithine aminotransferase family protein [Infirmifilum sp. NZ]UNQ72592.1 acetyl ornithine aminotransferase family protein [Infirmifilum sp. NZ]
MSRPEIRITPPGPKAREVASKDSELIMQSFARWYPFVAKRGQGVWLEDVDGNKYLDFNSGIGVTNVGHAHPKVVKAIKEQAERLLHYSLTDFLYETPVQLAEKLVKITPGSFPKKVFYANSGAEAIEAAIKVARGHFRGTRPYIIAFAGSFHGRTMGALSLTASKPVQRRGFAPLVPGVVHVPYPYCYRCPFRQKYPDCNLWCVDYIEEWVLKKYVPPEEVAAIVFEPIAGEGGYIVPPPDFFKRLKELADKYGILLVDDEVQAGIGRTGKWFAIEHWGVEPDLVAIAKGIASGLPLGVLVGRKDVMDLPPGSHASTFGGNPVSCAAAIATLEVIEEERLLENAARVGEDAMRRLNELKEEVPAIGDVRGKGLMIGVELVKPDGSPNPELLKATLENAFKSGLLVIGAGVSTIRIAPPLIITKEEIDVGLEILSDSLKKALRTVG